MIWINWFPLTEQLKIKESGFGFGFESNASAVVFLVNKWVIDVAEIRL